MRPIWQAPICRPGGTASRKKEEINKLISIVEELAENQGITPEGTHAITELATLASVKSYKDRVHQAVSVVGLEPVDEENSFKTVPALNPKSKRRECEKALELRKSAPYMGDPSLFFIYYFYIFTACSNVSPGLYFR